MQFTYIVDEAVAQRTAELLNQNAFTGIEAKHIDRLLVECNSQQVKVIRMCQAHALQETLDKLKEI